MSTPINFMGRERAEAKLHVVTPTRDADKQDIPLHFNPAEYTLSKQNNFIDIPIPGLETPPQQWLRGAAETLTIDKLTVDTTDTLDSVAAKYVDRMRDLLNKDPKLHAPPIVQFIWAKAVFTGVISQLDVKYMLFHSDGKPLRAEIKLVMKEYKTAQVQYKSEGQHNSSPDVEKRYVVRAGETLSSISAAVFRDPSHWRELATANDIVDPRRVAPGTVLTVPPLTGGRA